MLMANGDQVTGLWHIIGQALKHANSEAFCPVRKRDIYNLDPQDTLLGELDSAYQGLIFLECSPESPDLESIMGDSVDPDTKQGQGASPRLNHKVSISSGFRLC